MLNCDQHAALSAVQDWWRNKNLQVYLIDGKGGVGKTYLVQEIIKQLPGCAPVLLAPTNEAVNQLREKVKGDFIFKTVHSALGMAPTTHTEDLDFEQASLPSFWGQVNLAVVDEGSMIDSSFMGFLLGTGVKLLFLGHKSQLPPVKLKLGVFDKCVSPVFEQNYPTSTLTIPMRNTGKIWDFNGLLEEAIYDKNTPIPTDFDITNSQFEQYILSPEGIEAIQSGSCKIIMWTNQGVDLVNAKLRELIFPGQAYVKYLPTDKIILTAPVTVIGRLENFNAAQALRLSGQKNKTTTFFSNTKAEVVTCDEVVIYLTSSLIVPCYKIKVLCDGIKTTFYEVINEEDNLKISNHYKDLALAAGSQKAKHKAFRNMHFMDSLFAKIKHYYAATTYRMQGASVPTVIIMVKDINKCSNPIARAKHKYVAASRVINHLMLYKGDIFNV